MKKINIIFTSLFAIAFLVAPIGVFAQDKDSVEEVIVTGSYLKGSAVDGASPVEIISRDTIENLGATTIADIIRNMAIDSGSENNADSFTAGSTQGSSSVNLRGLGLSSTLVLFDGKRNTIAAQTANDGSVFVDTNSLPVNIIERVEVLKEGAASVYGSDAVAGVVNYIFRRDFTGFEVNASKQQTDVGSQTDDRLSFLMGTEINDANIVVSLSSLNRSPLPGTAIPEYAQLGNSSFGSSFLIYPPAALDDLTPDQFVTTVADGPYAGTYNILSYVPDANCAANNGIFIPMPDDESGLSGGTLCGFFYGDRFNYVNDEDHFQSYFSVQKTLANGIDFEIDYLMSEVDVNDNPQSPSYPALSYLTLPNIIMPGASGSPFSYPVLFRGRVLGSASPSKNAPRANENDRFSIELSGTLENGYDWSLSYTDSSQTASYFQPDTSTSKLRDAVRGVGGASGDQLWNLFDPSSNSAELTEYISSGEKRTTDASLSVIDAVITGTAGNFDIAAGIQFKEETFKIRRNADSISQFNDNGDVIVNSDLIFLGGGSENDDSKNSSAIFVETSTDVNEKLQLKGAVRYESLENDNPINPKISARYQASDNLVFRGSLSTSFREPSLVQLNSDLVSLQGLQDYKADGTTNGGPAFIRVAVASNADLVPEESDNMNFGAIWTPNDQTSLTVDYWAIDYKNVITIENAQGKLIADPNGPDIKRSVGTLLGVTTRTYNASKINASGLDVEAKYSFDTPIGDAFVAVNHANIMKYEIPDGSGGMKDVVGNFNYDNFARSMPENKTIISAQLNSGNHQVAAFYRMISDYKTNRPLDAFAKLAGITQDIGEFNTLDLRYNYNMELKDNTIQLSAGINNVADEKPPLVADAANWAYDPKHHDVRGKMFYLGIKLTR
ncbi:TonB-dependent receptor [Gammaproteobacteria bacterium]|nr:TonB-dependent receptor [Gammaproteobacteria bacterium]